jgi:hypothetical protein
LVESETTVFFVFFVRIAHLDRDFTANPQSLPSNSSLIIAHTYSTTFIVFLLSFSADNMLRAQVVKAPFEPNGRNVVASHLTITQQPPAKVSTSFSNAYTVILLSSRITCLSILWERALFNLTKVTRAVTPRPERSEISHCETLTFFISAIHSADFHVLMLFDRTKHGTFQPPLRRFHMKKRCTSMTRRWCGARCRRTDRSFARCSQPVRTSFKPFGASLRDNHSILGIRLACQRALIRISKRLVFALSSAHS